MKFPCIACGLCCRMSGKVRQLADLIDASGRCRYFDETTHLCRIYDHRPTVCNVDQMYDLYFHNDMTRKEFYLKNLEACCLLNQAAGLAENLPRLHHLIKILKTSPED